MTTQVLSSNLSDLRAIPLSPPHLTDSKAVLRGKGRKCGEGRKDLGQQVAGFEQNPYGEMGLSSCGQLAPG